MEALIYTTTTVEGLKLLQRELQLMDLVDILKLDLIQTGLIEVAFILTTATLVDS